MRTIARRLLRALADPGSAVAVIVGVLVGALGGGAYEARAPTHTAPARRDGVYKGIGDD
jgi:phage-related minor tail protein